MIIPYSTDAPIYHFPWMTIVLIVLNCAAFAITGMGYNNDGWLLQYGNGLHPVEWIAYNFIHFGIAHLLGNMFFLWAFGIVVEGKLGWWKFLSVYMTIGIVGGFLIQVTMLGYKPSLHLGDLLGRDSADSASWFEPKPAFAQESIFDADMEGDDAASPDADADLPDGMAPGGIGAEQESDAALAELLARRFKPGAGGASLVVFALLGIVLVWAPKNEVSCLWIGINAGTFEVEYIYFCGLKIGSEIVGAVLGSHGFEVTSEIAHALGAVLGFGIGAAFVKLNWVDCENWDLFAYAQNRHGSMEHVGSWQDAAAIAVRKDTRVSTPVSEDDEGSDSRGRTTKKKRPLPKLKALSSMDDDVPDLDVEEVDGIEIVEEGDSSVSKSRSSKRPVRGKSSSASEETDFISGPSTSTKSNFLPALPKPPTANGPSSITARSRNEKERDPDPKSNVSKSDGDHNIEVAQAITLIRTALKAEKLNEALALYRKSRANHEEFQLPMMELRLMADGFFKQQNVRDSKPFLEEFIERFPDESDRQRIKLAVLNVKFLKRPTAALKLLAKVDRSTLPDEYQAIHKDAARVAQQMISDGMTDAP